MQRDARMDMVRVLATVLVVGIHATSFVDHMPISDVEWVWSLLYVVLTSPAVPVFVMLSGALVLAPEKTSDPVRILKKRVLRLVVIFLVWSVVYMVYDSVRLSRPLQLKDALMAIYSGYFHMWYLRMTVVLYLGIPIFKWILTNRQATHWYLAMWMIFGIGLATVKNNPYVSKLATDFQDAAFPEFFIGYSGYFLLGRYLTERKWTRREALAVAGIGVLGAGLIYGCSYVMSVLLNDKVYVTNSFDFPVFLFAVSIFVAGTQLPSPRQAKAHSMLRQHADCSLGIYLIHMIWLNALYALFDFEPIAVWLRVPLVTALCYLASFGAIWLLRKIPLFRKHLS